MKSIVNELKQAVWVQASPRMQLNAFSMNMNVPEEQAATIAQQLKMPM